MTEMIKLPSQIQGPDPYGLCELAVCSNPGGRFHGWLFRRHPDGQWVSWRKLEIDAQPWDPALKVSP